MEKLRVEDNLRNVYTAKRSPQSATQWKKNGKVVSRHEVPRSVRNVAVLASGVMDDETLIK